MAIPSVAEVLDQALFAGAPAFSRDSYPTGYAMIFLTEKPASVPLHLRCLAPDMETLMHAWAGELDVDQRELETVLADAYLILNGIPKR